MKHIDTLYQWYRLRRSREFMESHDKEMAWQQIQRRIRRRHRLMVWRRCCSAAACIAVMVALGWWYASSRTATPADTPSIATLVPARQMSRHQAQVTVSNAQCRVAVPMGASYSEQLADGTHIVINADTRLTYPETFETHRREVALTGEAYFEVAHRADAPFVVTTPAGSIEVLGTHFNVMAAADRTTVTLAEGSVRLRFGHREFTMQPGQQASITSSGDIDVRTVNTRNYTSWSTGTYDFSDTPLSEIVRQLSLWYGVSIHIDSPEVAASRYTGVITRSESLQQALDLLTTISDLRFEVEGDHINVK